MEKDMEKDTEKIVAMASRPKRRGIRMARSGKGGRKRGSSTINLPHLKSSDCYGGNGGCGGHRHHHHQQVEEEEEEEDGGEEVSGDGRMSLAFDLARGGHPYGVRPLGNLYLDEVSGNMKGNVRDIGLGDLATLSDVLVLDILGILSGRDLARLGCVSKAFYVFSHQDELWRPLVLDELHGDFRFTESWRETYRRSKSACSSIAASPETRHVALQVKGFYSDHLFQSWLCASLEIKEEWLRRDNIVRRSWPELTVDDFVKKFEEANRPVLITGLINQWPAYELWNRDYLLKASADVSFACGPVDMRLEDFYMYADSVEEERPIYLFDARFGEKVPQFVMDYEVPEYFAEDLFSVLGHEGRPDFRWLIIGPARSGSSFHIDPNSTAAWNAVIRGTKKWIMYPPDMVPPGVHPSPDGADVASPVSITEWFMNFYDQVARDINGDGVSGGGKSRLRPVECLCKEGEMVFVPQGWWHIVLNLEDSVAVTQNYVSRRNLLQVLEFLKSPNAKIVVSGTGDREHLYDRFRSKYEEIYPGSIADLEAKVKEKAEKKTKTQSFWDGVADVNSQAGGFKFGF